VAIVRTGRPTDVYYHQEQCRRRRCRSAADNLRWRRRRAVQRRRRLRDEALVPRRLSWRPGLCSRSPFPPALPPLRRLQASSLRQSARVIGAWWTCARRCFGSCSNNNSSIFSPLCWRSATSNSADVNSKGQTTCTERLTGTNLHSLLGGDCIN